MDTVPISEVYNAFLSAGFPDAWARAFTAETGRETGFNPRFIYGTHSDPANRATNFGLMSFQGQRRADVLDFLRQAGRIGEGGEVLQGPETLRAQAQFIKREVETNPAYARTREQLMANPNIDPEQAAAVLGRNYIRWRFDDPKYAHHHDIRRSYLASIPAAQGSLDTVQANGLLSPQPMAPPPTDAQSKMVYSQDLGTMARRLGHTIAPDWIDPAQMIPQEQAQREAAMAAQSQRDLAGAMGAFGAMQAAGLRQDALAQRPTSLLQPSIVRGQFRPIQPMRGLL